MHFVMSLLILLICSKNDCCKSKENTNKYRANSPIVKYKCHQMAAKICQKLASGKSKFRCWKENIPIILKFLLFLVLTVSFATLSKSLKMVYVIQCMKKFIKSTFEFFVIC